MPMVDDREIPVVEEAPDKSARLLAVFDAFGDGLAAAIALSPRLRASLLAATTAEALDKAVRERTDRRDGTASPLRPGVIGEAMRAAQARWDDAAPVPDGAWDRGIPGRSIRDLLRLVAEDCERVLAAPNLSALNLEACSDDSPAADPDRASEEARLAVAKALTAAQGNPKGVYIVDAGAETGAKHHAIGLLIEQANRGNPVAMFVSTDKGAAALSIRVRAEHAAVPGRDPDFEVVHARSMNRLCKHTRGLVAAEGYCQEEKSLLCGRCFSHASCEYHAILERVGKPFTFTVATHAMAPYIMRRMSKDTAAVFADMPSDLGINEVRYSLPAFQAVLAAEFKPKWTYSSRRAQDGVLLWYRARRHFAQLCVELVETLAGELPQDSYVQYAPAAWLADAVRTNEMRWRRALQQRPWDGQHPSLEPDKLDDGEKAKPGFHVPSDFDALRSPFLALLDGHPSMAPAVGRLTVYVDKKGRPPGLALARWSQKLPPDHGVVILSAGASSLEPLLTLAWQTRSLSFDFVRSPEPRFVQRIGIQTTALSMTKLRASPAYRQKTVLRLVLDVLHDLDAARRKHQCWSAGLGVVLPPLLEKELRNRKGGAAVAMDLLEAAGFDVMTQHYGELEDSKEFAMAAAFAIFGRLGRNFSRIGFQADCVRGESPVQRRQLTSEALQGLLASFDARQAEDVPRPAARTSASPLLMVLFDGRLDGFTRKRAGQQRATGFATVAAEIAARRLFDANGWCRVESVLNLLEGVETAETRAAIELDHFSKELIPLLLGRQKNTKHLEGGTGGAAPLKSFLKGSDLTQQPCGSAHVRRAIMSVAKWVTARKLLHTNPAGSGRTAVWVVPGCEERFHAWHAAEQERCRRLQAAQPPAPFEAFGSESVEDFGDAGWDEVDITLKDGRRTDP